MHWLLRILKKIFKIESKQEYAYKITIYFLKQFGFTENDKEELSFFYTLFLEWGKTKNGIKNLYGMLNNVYFVFVKLLKAETGSLKSLDPDASTEIPNKKHVLRLMMIVISKSKTKENFRKIAEAIDQDEVISNSLPSVIIRFLIPIMIENISQLNISQDLPKFASIVEFYRNTVNQEITTFLENVFNVYLEIYLKFKSSVDINLFAIQTIQDMVSFIDIFKENKEIIKLLIKQVVSSYIIFHINNYGEYSDEFKEYFTNLLKNIKIRYEQDEALLQAILMDLPHILKLSKSLNDITMYIQTLDQYIVDFIEIAKSGQALNRLEKNNMFFYASRKMKKDIYTAESLLIHYTAYALPSILEASQDVELFAFCRTIVKDLMETFNDIEIGFYYAYVVLPRWIKVNKNQDTIFDMHEKLKKLLYPLQKDMEELVRFFYFDFKDYMI